MSRVLVFDTETTGLWKFKLPTDHPTQPEAVQLAASLVNDEDGRILGQVNFIIKATSDCEPEAAAIHGVTPKLIEEAGVARRVAIASFHNLLKASEKTVAHNWDFDSKIIRRAYFLENSSSEVFDKMPSFCTMKSSTDICRLPGKIPGKYKWPSLQEAYKMFIDPNGFDGAHDAMVDVNACLKVYLHLREMFDDRLSA
jgi:DNA polymerase III epsilon subunit-like protein